jgi:hypothetical protein
MRYWRLARATGMKSRDTDAYVLIGKIIAKTSKEVYQRIKY